MPFALARRKIEYSITNNARYCFLAVGWALEHAAHMLGSLAENGLGVADDVGAAGGTKDDQDFERLKQHPEVAVGHVAAEHGADDDQKSDDKEHAPGVLSRRRRWSGSVARRRRGLSAPVHHDTISAPGVAACAAQDAHSGALYAIRIGRESSGCDLSCDPAHQRAVQAVLADSELRTCTANPAACSRVIRSPALSGSRVSTMRSSSAPLTGMSVNRR